MGQVPEQAIWEGVIQQDAGWCYPTEDGAKSAMRDVYSNYSNYVGMSRKLKKHILNNFTEEEMTTKFADAVWEGEKTIDVQSWIDELELQSHE